jgi:hypothetical protein
MSLSIDRLDRLLLLDDGKCFILIHGEYALIRRERLWLNVLRAEEK